MLEAGGMRCKCAAGETVTGRAVQAQGGENLYLFVPTFSPQAQARGHRKSQQSHHRHHTPNQVGLQALMSRPLYAVVSKAEHNLIKYKSCIVIYYTINSIFGDITWTWKPSLTIVQPFRDHPYISISTDFIVALLHFPSLHLPLNLFKHGSYVFKQISRKFVQLFSCQLVP